MKNKLLHAAACMVQASVELISKASDYAETPEEKKRIQKTALDTGTPLMQYHGESEAKR